MWTILKLVPTDPGRKMQKDSDLLTEERTRFQSLLGKISWLSYVSRPDLKWDVYNYSRKNKNPTVKDLDQGGIKVDGAETYSI